MRRGLWAASRLARLAAALLVCASFDAHALNPEKPFHDYVRDSWSIEQGLPQITVSAIAQTGDGYIWIGTQSGLARFDGVRFVNFTPDDTPALSGLVVNSLFVDRDDRLWIGTYKGLSWMKDGVFHAVTTTAADEANLLSVSDIRQSQLGEILVSTTSGLFRFKNDHLVPFGDLRIATSGILQSGDDLWVGGMGGVYRGQRDGSAMQFLRIAELGTSEKVKSLVTAQGRIWAATEIGLFYFEAGRWQRIQTESGLLNSAAIGNTEIGLLYEDRDQNLWVGSHKGLGRVRDGRITEFFQSRTGERLDNFLTGFEDHEGDLWLGSSANGISRFWSGWTRRYSVREGLDAPTVMSLSRGPDGKVWVGTDDGLRILDHGRFEIAAEQSALPSPNVYTLLAEEDEVWIGTLGGPALYRDQHVELPPQLAPMEGVKISGIVRDQAGRLLFASNEGLFILDQGRLTRAEGLSDPRTRMIYQTRAGRLLLGTQRGLWELTAEDRLIAVGSNQGLPSNIDVIAIHELADGRLVIGTLGEQLFLFDGKNWTSFSKDDGLPRNSAFFLTDDGEFLWIAGIRGLNRVPLAELRGDTSPKHPNSLHAEILLSARGEPNSGQHAECCNGAGNGKGFMENHTLWLPTVDGVVTVCTDEIVESKIPPAVRIEQIRIHNEWQDARDKRNAHLPADARDLSFAFTALTFRDPLSSSLLYRLRGYDHDWRRLETPTKREVSYTNLPPGDYSFEVRAANSAGIWSTNVARLPFSIQPHFYETIWFYALLALALFFLIAAAYRLKLSNLTARRELLESLVAQRTEALAAVNRQLREASYTDPLTGLHNRRYLVDQMPRDIGFYQHQHGSVRFENQVLLFVIIDIDHFKKINDRWGHGGGDRVLQSFTKLLLSHVRSGDYSVRWGGEEFLLVTRPMPRARAQPFVERIRAAVEAQAFDVGNGQTLRLTCSIGFSEFALEQSAPLDIDWQVLVELADRALYYVKRTQRNGWATYRPASGEDLEQLLNDLRENPDQPVREKRVVRYTSILRREAQAET